MAEVLYDPDMPEYDWQYVPAAMGVIANIIAMTQLEETGEIEALGDFPIIDVTGDS